MENVPNRRAETYSDQGFLILVIASFFFVGFLAQWQDDTWWLLRTGAEIWRTRSIPQVETLSMVSPAGAPLKLHEWLTALLLFVIFQSTGHVGVQISCSLCLGATAALLARWLRGSCPARACALLALLPLFVLTLSARPQLLGYACFAATLVAVREHRLRLIPPILFVWAQMHASVVLGLAYVIASLVISSLANRQRWKSAFTTALASIVATITNPLGPAIFPFVLESTERLRQLGLQEWLPLTWSSTPGVYAILLLLTSLFVIVRNIRRIKVTPEIASYALFAATLFAQSAQHIRYLPLWAIMQVGITAGLHSSNGAWSGLQGSLRSKELRRLAALLCCTGVVYAVSVATLYSGALRWFPIDDRGIVDLQTAPEPLFTTYNTGGYVLWFAPAKKSFIDSRQDPFELSLLLQVTEAQRSGVVAELFERWGFRSALVETGSPSHSSLLASGWKLRWQNGALSLLERERRPEQEPFSTE